MSILRPIVIGPSGLEEMAVGDYIDPAVIQGGGSGTTDHNELTNRDAPNQHPISAITDLQTALNGKQVTLVSGTNIKTVGGNSLLGSGDIPISGGGVTIHNDLTGKDADDQHPISAITDLQTELDSKIEERYGGVIVEPSFADNGDGTVTIGSGTYDLYHTTDNSGDIYRYIISGGTFTPNNNAIGYIYARYNSGSPSIAYTTNQEDISQSSEQIIFTIFREGNSVRLVSWDGFANGLSEKLHNRLIKTARFVREFQGGLVLSESATRIINISAGKIWYGAVRIELPIYNSSSHFLRFYYHSSGSWDYNDSLTQYNNTQYDDGTNLVEINPNKWTVNYIYRMVYSTGTPRVSIVLGNNYYGSMEEARTSTIPTLPDEVLKLGVLVGRILVKKDATTGTIEQISDVSFMRSAVMESVSSISDWQTSTLYVVGQEVLHLGLRFVCKTQHTSSTFSADLANWESSQSHAKIVYQPSHGFSELNVLYYYNDPYDAYDTIEYFLAQADSEDTLSDPPMIVVSENTDYFLVVWDDIVRIENHGLTPNEVYRLSEITAGGLTLDETTTGYHNPILKVLNDDEIHVLNFRPLFIADTSSVVEAPDDAVEIGDIALFANTSGTKLIGAGLGLPSSDSKIYAIKNGAWVEADVPTLTSDLTVNFLTTDSHDEMQAKIDAIPKYIGVGVTLIFQFPNGTVTLDNKPLVFSGFQGGGAIFLYGQSGDFSAGATKSSIVDGTARTSGDIIEISRNIGIYMQVYGLEIRSDSTKGVKSLRYYQTSGAATQYCSFVGVGASINASNYGLHITQSSFISGFYCYFGNIGKAIVTQADSQGRVMSNYKISGTDLDHGYYTVNGGWIIKSDSIQPTGCLVADEEDANVWIT